MVEMVWDAERHGTGRTASGASLAIGDEAHFSPDDLVCLAAASCLMKTLLGMAEDEGVPLLSYLSTAELIRDAAESGSGRVRIRAYVSTDTDDDRRRLEALSERARTGSPIACLLGDRVEVVADVRVLEATRRSSA